LTSSLLLNARSVSFQTSSLYFSIHSKGFLNSWNLIRKRSYSLSNVSFSLKVYGSYLNIKEKGKPFLIAFKNSKSMKNYSLTLVRSNFVLQPVTGHFNSNSFFVFSIALKMLVISNTPKCLQFICLTGILGLPQKSAQRTKNSKFYYPPYP
jgi:hypothetical protein